MKPSATRPDPAKLAKLQNPTLAWLESKAAQMMFRSLPESVVGQATATRTESIVAVGLLYQVFNSTQFGFPSAQHFLSKRAVFDSVPAELPGLFRFTSGDRLKCDNLGLAELLEKHIRGQTRPSLLLGSVQTGQERQA